MSTSNMTSQLTDAQIDKLARTRAGMRMGWLIHAFVYLAVNALLLVLSFASGRHWAVFPLLGWGLGLAIHGAVVLMSLPGAGLRERMVQQERARLMARRG